MTLAEGLRAKEEDIMKAKKAGETITPHEIARKNLHRLQSSTNRRMHKGFPEMLTYLLNKPMEYCSHMFVTVPYDPLYRVIYKLVLAYNGFETRKGYPEMVPVARKPRLIFSDYQFRPKSLDRFPLYIFLRRLRCSSAIM